jgi:hypothetical protein
MRKGHRRADRRQPYAKYPIKQHVVSGTTGHIRDEPGEFRRRLLNRQSDIEQG